MHKLEIGQRLFHLSVKHPGLTIGVWGEAGIGKTFAIRALLANAKIGNLSLHATTPINQLLAALPSTNKLPVWAMQTIKKLLKEEYVEATETGAAIGAVLAENAPLIFYLEDIHETNNERLEMIRALANGVLKSNGVALIVSSRKLPPEPFVATRLKPMNENESNDLLVRELGTDLPASAKAWVYNRAVGNPLFTLEHFRALARQGFLWNDGQRWHWRSPEKKLVPLTVEALIETSLQEVTTDKNVAATLGARALLGTEASALLRAEVADVSLKAMQHAEQQLRVRGILRDDDFAHPLYREIALQGMDENSKSNLAKRALKAMQKNPREGAKFVEAAKLSNKESLAWLERAAAAATKAGNSVEAAKYLSRASLFAPAANRATLALQAAEALRHVDVLEAQRLAEIASANPEQRNDALFLIADLLTAQGKSSEAEQTLMGLSKKDQQQPAWLERRFQLYSTNREYSRALELLAQHPKMLEEADPITIYRAAWSYAHTGNTVEAERICQKALKQKNLSNHARSYLLKGLATTAHARNDWKNMELLEKQVFELSQETGNLRVKDAALYNRAIALANLGRYQERMRCLEAAIEVCKALGDTTALVIAQKTYGSALTLAGEFEQAETLLQEARDALMRIDTSRYLQECETELANLYLDWQPPHGRVLAQKHATAAVVLARHFHDPAHTLSALLVLAVAEAWMGNATQSAAHIEEANTLITKENSSSDLYSIERAKIKILMLQLNSKPDVLQKALVETLAWAKKEKDEIGLNTFGLHLAQLQNNTKTINAHLAWFKKNGLGLHFGKRFSEKFGLDTKTQKKQSVSTTPKPMLQILGPMRFAGQLLRGRKRQEFLAELLEARIQGRVEVPRLTLIEKLYGNHNEAQANASLKALVHQIRSDTGNEIICTTPQGYALGKIESDAELFLQNNDTRLWHGQYLEDLGSNPMVRESLYRALTVVLQKQFSAKEANTKKIVWDKTETLRIAHLLLEAEPYNQEVLSLSLQVQQANNPNQTQNLYEKAKLRFLEVGVQLPEIWSGNLNA